MKTKSELIAKAMKAAVKAANGEEVVLSIGSNWFTKVDATPKKETWRERNLRRQAEGVRFQCKNPLAETPEREWFPPRKQMFTLGEENYREVKKETWQERNLRRQAEGVKFEYRINFMNMGEEWISSQKGWTFDTKEENYREVKPESKPLPHAELRALWQKYRDEGKEVVWQVMPHFHSEWVDLSPNASLLWLETNRYRVKPITTTVWFALGIPVRTTTGHRTFSSTKSLPDLLAKMAYYRFDPLGKIESREVEIKP